MDRITYESARSEQRARGLKRQGCLSQLHARSVDRQCHVDSVIDKKRGIIIIAKTARLFGEREKLFSAQIFFAQLYRFDAAVQGFFQYP